MNVKRNNKSDSHDCAAISSSSSSSNKREEKNCYSLVFVSKQQQKKKSSTLTLAVRWYVVVFVILSQVILQAAAVITTPISPGGFWSGSGPSIAVAVSGGIPIIVFYHSSGQLYYIRCGDATCSASNTIRAIDDFSSGDVGTDVAIAIASSGFAVISYCDWGNSNLMIAHCNDLVCSSPSNVLVDSVEFEFLGQYTSIALQATTNYPVISYYDDSNTNLKVAACSSVDCTTKTITVVDGDTSTAVGLWSSLKLRSNGSPTIVYYDGDAGKLMFVACGDFACTPAGNTYKTLNTGNTNDLGYFASLALDSQDLAVISYYDSTLDKLVLTRCSDVLCSSANTNYVDDASNSVGLWSSVVVPPNGLPIISYIGSNEQLKIANCSDTSCSQASISTPDTTTSMHLLTSIALLGSSNIVVAYAAEGSLQVYTDTNILPCPEHSQLLSNGNCECEKGYYGDSVSTRLITPAVGAVCTFKCAYEGATCIETNDCCKPNTKFVCQNSQCALCRKLGSICTRNEQCCSGRCNRKASICREKL